MSLRSPHRELFGILGGLSNAPAILRVWNVYFQRRHVDASMERYTASVATLPERLSEMFHFDRRLYLVSPSLQAAVLPFLDVVESGGKQNEVSVIVNRNGVLHGYWIGDADVFLEPSHVLEITGIFL